MREQHQQNDRSNLGARPRSFFGIFHNDSSRSNVVSAGSTKTAGNDNTSVASTIVPDSIAIDRASLAIRAQGAAHGCAGQITGPGATNEGHNRDKIDITHVPERNVVGNQDDTAIISKLWWVFSRICTLVIHDDCMVWAGKTSESKQAWREKVAIFAIMLLSSAAFIVVCDVSNYAMYTVMVIIAVVLVVQCMCSLIYIVRWKRTITRDDERSKVIVMVPCYNEGDKELRKTIDSVIDTTYPSDNKVLLVVADGNITGKGEKKSTPETLAHILGYKMSPQDIAYKCKSIGDLTQNRAKLYYGTYKDCGTEMKYLVIVKCGLVSENGNSRAGNRGKRDSQLLLAGLLNRFHHGRDLNKLDEAIKNALESLQIPLDEIRYLMAIDADTRVDRDSISHMAYSMNKNERVLALCGETKVDNKTTTWVTMIQVFEYFTNHHMKKAFESVFGCVTCLPGCFTMYRLFSDDGLPLLSCDDVYQRYATNNVKTLHDKNLYHLGEDRMLTTLLLRYFPDMRLSFIPEAKCYTIVPDSFSVLLSQRRRWINSTFHNMLELARVNSMCGVLCFSMKTIVILDLVATLILPSSLIYVGYLFYLTFWIGEPLSKIMLVVWGVTVGVQVAVFLLRSRWDYWWWFFVFVVAGVPVFYFILPVYSFWNMDDFSWGATRQVGNDAVLAASAKANDSVDTTVQVETGSDIDLQANPTMTTSNQTSSSLSFRQSASMSIIDPALSTSNQRSDTASRQPILTPNDLDEEQLDNELFTLDEEVVGV